MPYLPKTTLHFLAELLKHQAKKQFGDGALTVLTDALTDYTGDSASEKLTAFLESGQNAEDCRNQMISAWETFSTQVLFAKTGVLLYNRNTGGPG